MVRWPRLVLWVLPRDLLVLWGLWVRCPRLLLGRWVLGARCHRLRLVRLGLRVLLVLSSQSDPLALPRPWGPLGLQGSPGPVSVSAW